MSAGIKIFIGLRGLARGNVHWGDFSDILKRQNNNSLFIPLEMAGNGERAIETSSMNPEDVIKDLRQQCKNRVKALGFDDNVKVNLVALSLGGMIALKWAELFPEEVENVFVVNSSLKQLSPLSERLLPRNYLKIVKMILFDDIREREEGILRITSNYYSLTKSHLPQFISSEKTHSFRVINFFRQLILAFRIRISIPLAARVIIVCSQNDRLVSAKCSQAIAKVFNCEIHINNYAGHDLPLDDGEWLSQLIVKY